MPGMHGEFITKIGDPDLWTRVGFGDDGRPYWLGTSSPRADAARALAVAAPAPGRTWLPLSLEGLAQYEAPNWTFETAVFVHQVHDYRQWLTGAAVDQVFTPEQASAVRAETVPAVIALLRQPGVDRNAALWAFSRLTDPATASAVYGALSTAATESEWTAARVNIARVGAHAGAFGQLRDQVALYVEGSSPLVADQGIPDGTQRPPISIDGLVTGRRGTTPQDVIAESARVTLTALAAEHGQEKADMGTARAIAALAATRAAWPAASMFATVDTAWAYLEAMDDRDPPRWDSVGTCAQAAVDVVAWADVATPVEVPPYTRGALRFLMSDLHIEAEPSITAATSRPVPVAAPASGIAASGTELGGLS